MQKSTRKQFASVDEYIASFPKDVERILEKVRQTVQKAAPEAVEVMSYGMPTFKLNGKPLVYFGGFAHHIGFYALPSGNEAFRKELSQYKVGKGSIQFPLDKPIPYDLVREIVQFRVRELSEGKAAYGKR